MAQIDIGPHKFRSYAPMERKEFTQKTPGEFDGWISRNWGIAWVISPDRRDKRTGAIPTDKATKAQSYMLQYEIKQPGERHRKARFQQIEASDQSDAVHQALSFMKSIGLDNGARARSTLYCNEQVIKLKEAKKRNTG